MISFETNTFKLSVDDLDLLYSGFFYIQETGSWTSVDSAQLLTDITWCNLRQFFVASDTTVCYFLAGSGISSWEKLNAQGHQGTILKKTRCTQNPGWKVVGYFFPFFCMEFAANWHYKIINTALTLTGFCALSCAGHIARTWKVSSHFTLACPLSIYPFSQFSGTICLLLSLANTAPM